MELAQSDPNSFFLLHPVPCFIDEVQRAEELFIKLAARKPTRLVLPARLVLPDEGGNDHLIL